MEIRPIPPEDLPAYQHIASLAFERGVPAEIEPERFNHPARHRIGVYDAGGLQACLTVLDFQMLFGHHRRPCGGIAGVQSHPAARGRGYAGALLRRSLEMMRESGQYLSSLWPFSFAYYRGYGWEWTGYTRQYKLPIRLLTTDPETQHVEEVRGDLPALLNPIYEARAVRYNGMLVRDADRWPGHLEPWDRREPAVYLYRRAGRAEGYAILRYMKDNETLRASDFVALSARAYRGLLGLIHRHGMTVEKTEWQAPPDDPFWSLVQDWSVETRVVPAGMSRVVDAAAALRALRPDPALRGALTLGLEDRHAPWNTGTWRITVEGGAVEIASTTETPGVALDIQALSQAYWGTPSLELLRPWDRVQVDRDADFGLLAALLPARTAWLADGF